MAWFDTQSLPCLARVAVFSPTEPYMGFDMAMSRYITLAALSVASGLPEQFRQPGEVRRHPPGLVLEQHPPCRAVSG
jgi:hypothetical protein